MEGQAKRTKLIGYKLPRVDAGKFPIATSRTLLRRLVPTDLADFQQYRHDEAVGRYQGWLPQSDADAADFLREKGDAEFLQPGKWFQIGIADRETDTLIGDVGICLSATKPEAEFGFTLRRQSQGLGLASEAIGAVVDLLFEETDIRRIIGVVDTRNLVAIKLLERLGMQRLQTNKAMFRGSPCDEHLFALGFMRATIRPATEKDAAELADIYNHYVSNTYITFETGPVTSEQMAQRIAETTAKLPWLVAEASGRILGHAYASTWKRRHAYRYSVESTIYLQPNQTGKGVGTPLYSALIDAIKSTSMHSVIGGISLPNEPSIRLHERLGFKKIGHFEEVGYKQDRWVDVGYWQLTFRR